MPRACRASSCSSPGGGLRTCDRDSELQEFCYQIAPGQDYYHRLLDGEIYLHKADEKLCLPCAARRGLLTYDPKILRDPIEGVNVAIDELFDDGFDVAPGDGDGAAPD